MRTVMVRLQSRLPGVNRLVLVRVQHSMRFAARMVLIGNNMPWPYWEIAGTEGERLRKADHRDLWCYWPDESPDVLHVCDCGAEWEGPATEAKCGHCITDGMPPIARGLRAGAGEPASTEDGDAGSETPTCSIPNDQPEG